MRAFPGTRRHSAATESLPRCRCCGSIRGPRPACLGGWHSIRPGRSMHAREWQGCVHGARLVAGGWGWGRGQREVGEGLARGGRLPVEGFGQAFWCEERGTYALAVDGAKEPCRVRTWNGGQLLFS